MIMKIKPPYKLYVISNQDNEVIHAGLYEKENDCWIAYLGYPTKGEIYRAKEKFSCKEVQAT